MQTSRRFYGVAKQVRCSHSFSSKSRLLNQPSSHASNAEISHFNNLAASWWDPHGPSRLLQLMNPLRHDFISSCLSPERLQQAKLRYLDVGCGGGIFAESAARLVSTASVTAIDPSPAVIAAARKHALTDPDLRESTKIRYLHTGIEALPVPKNPEDGVDVLALWEVIEHVNFPAEFLRACMPHVRPGGWLVLSTISRTWASWLVTKMLAEDVLRVVPRGTHDWAKYILPEELEEFFYKEDGWASLGSNPRVQGCIYIPTVGWRFVDGGENWGNYFFGVRRELL